MRLLVELTVATSIPFAVWAAEDDAVIATAVDVLNEQAERAEAR